MEKKFKIELAKALVYCSRTPENYKLPSDGNDLISIIVDSAIELTTGQKGLIRSLPGIEVVFNFSHAPNYFRKDFQKINDLFQKKIKESCLDKQINDGLIWLLEPIEKQRDYRSNQRDFDFSFTKEYYSHVSTEPYLIDFSLTEKDLYEAKTSFDIFTTRQQLEIKEIGLLVRCYLDKSRW